MKVGKPLPSYLGCRENAVPTGQNFPWYSWRQSDPQCGLWLAKSKQIKFKSQLLAGPGLFRKTMRKSHKTVKVNKGALSTAAT